MMKLEVKNLTKKYGDKTALNNVNFSLEAGIYALLGPNGAGKSTLMKIVTDNLNATSGEALWNGESTLKLGASFRELIGYMPQQQGIYENFTLRRFLWYFASLKGLTKAQAKASVAQSAELVNLTSELDRKLGGFSGGMKQRALFAQALLGEPKILIFDEPTAGLDPKERIRIRNLISEFALDRVVIIATHIVSDIEFIAKEILILKAGILLGKKTPSEFLKEMDSKVWEIYLSKEELHEIQNNYKVGNLRSAENGQICVRLISDVPPEGALKVPPTLEDVYLHYFGDEL
jgi:ABC-type multidrug transport system ATPase subunit